jgi:transposase
MAIEVKEHDSIEELKREIRQAKDGKYRNRLQTILLSKQKKKVKDIKEYMLISHPTYISWIKKYNDGGKEALRDMCSGRKGGNPKWDKAIFEALFKKLDSMEEWWSVPKMREWIEEEYKKSIPKQTIEYHLHKNNYSWKTNRPSPYKGDKQKQEDFKKTQLKRWLKS